MLKWILYVNKGWLKRIHSHNSYSRVFLHCRPTVENWEVNGWETLVTTVIVCCAHHNTCSIILCSLHFVSQVLWKAIHIMVIQSWRNERMHHFLSCSFSEIRSYFTNVSYVEITWSTIFNYKSNIAPMFFTDFENPTVESPTVITLTFSRSFRLCCEPIRTNFVLTLFNFRKLLCIHSLTLAVHFSNLSTASGESNVL